MSIIGQSSVVKPTMRVQVLGTVSNGYQIINRADVGGQYLNEWQTAKTTWVTTVRRFNTTPLDVYKRQIFDRDEVLCVEGLLFLCN